MNALHIYLPGLEAKEEALTPIALRFSAKHDEWMRSEPISNFSQNEHR